MNISVELTFSPLQDDFEEHIINFIKKITHITPLDIAERLAIQQEIENTQPLTERVWLLQKISLLQ